MPKKNDSRPTNSTEQIYLSLDHLNSRDYVLNIMRNNKIITSIPIQLK